MSPSKLLRVCARPGLTHGLCVVVLLGSGVGAPSAFAQSADDLTPPPPFSGSPAPGTPPPGTPPANPGPPVSPPPGVAPAPAAPGVAPHAAAPAEPDDEFAEEFDAPPADEPAVDVPATDVVPGDTPTDASADAAETGDAANAPDARLRVLVIDAAPYGVDPVVGEHVSAQLRFTAAQLGYAVATRDESVAAAQRASMPFPPSPADLWRVTWAGDAQRGVFARVWAQDARYVIEISVASMDGAGPFFARGNSGAEDLHDVVDGLLRQALPPPDRWDAEAAVRYAQGSVAGAAPSVDTALPTPGPTASPFAPVGGQGLRLESRRRRSHRPSRRFDLALSTEAAVDTSSDHFYNHLVGARVDLRITTEILLGAYVGYANLRGRDGRAQNVLFYLLGENRIRLGDGTDLTIPLRFAIGYLPFNGPFVRLSAGLNLPVSERVELGVDLIAPTFWVIPTGVAVSADFGLEVIYRL